MKIIENPKEMQLEVLRLKKENSIAVVPTMGALHKGHLSLILEAKKLADIVIVTIFVNPTQFGEGEDLDSYPRTFKNDCALSEEYGASIIFAPKDDSMYPKGYGTTVACGVITDKLEGNSRPTHFDGVTTVVLKLFNIIQPNFAIFGQKDAQQVLVIKQMVRDLNIPVEIIVGKTVRELDGLAMSSRNLYLTESERAEVMILNKGLLHIKNLAENGVFEVSELMKSFIDYCSCYNMFIIEYIAFTNFSCEKIDEIIKEETLISLACRTVESNTRLIDNIFI